MASKRDYVAMAARVRLLNDKIAESGALVTPGILASVRELAEGIADMYAAGNPRFDRDRFMAACGFGTVPAPAPELDITGALQARQPFTDGKLTGEQVTPWRQRTEYRQWADGSVARIFAGALNEHGTAGTTGCGSPLPALGRLDPAPAMAMALGEASYVVRSYGTPIAWWLGPEVYGAGAGAWIEVAERCNADYGRFTSATTHHQNRVHAALAAIG